MAGAGYNVPDIDAKLAKFAQHCTEIKAEGIDLRSWFDRISSDVDDEVAAAALIAAIEADGGVLEEPKALKIIQAMREMTYWAMTFAPTHTLDVRGPSALI